MRSLRGAINAKCKECIYDPYDAGAGTWREQVAACGSSDCSLWPYRPLPKPPRDAGEADSHRVSAPAGV